MMGPHCICASGKLKHASGAATQAFRSMPPYAPRIIGRHSNWAAQSRHEPSNIDCFRLLSSESENSSAYCGYSVQTECLWHCCSKPAGSDTMLVILSGLLQPKCNLT